MEEEKALKKIEETRKKARQIIDLKIQNERKIRAKSDKSREFNIISNELTLKKVDVRKSVNDRQEDVMKLKLEEA